MLLQDGSQTSRIRSGVFLVFLSLGTRGQQSSELSRLQGQRG